MAEIMLLSFNSQLWHIGQMRCDLPPPDVTQKSRMTSDKTKI